MSHGISDCPLRSGRTYINLSPAPLPDTDKLPGQQTKWCFTDDTPVRWFQRPSYRGTSDVIRIVLGCKPAIPAACRLGRDSAPILSLFPPSPETFWDHFATFGPSAPINSWPLVGVIFPIFGGMTM
ncbi:hypothetical protein Bbelb_038490 [Branchiostoma belcheri]|nr:hypothetical protein Bbelb_038490 [Branchiostoma belcheri]